MNEKLQKALSRLQDEEWERLEREDGPAHVFSETFERRMDGILREEKRKSRRIRRLRMRNAAAVLALCVLAGLGMVVAGTRRISLESGTETVAGSGETADETLAGAAYAEAEREESEVYRYTDIRLGLGVGSDQKGYTFTVVNDLDTGISIPCGSWKLRYLGSLRSGKNLNTIMRFPDSSYGMLSNVWETGRQVTVTDPLSSSLEPESSWISAGSSRTFSIKYGAEVMSEEGIYLLVTTWFDTNDPLFMLGGETDGLVAALVVVS